MNRAGLCASLSLVGVISFGLPAQAGELLCGGQKVTIAGESGVGDHLQGTPGKDVIHGLGWQDTIDGGAGADVICGGTGWDEISGGRGADIMYGDSGNDQLMGGPGSDILIGGERADRMDGGRGADDIRAWRGSDTVTGGPGDDLLQGGDQGGFEAEGGVVTVDYSASEGPVQVNLRARVAEGEGRDSLKRINGVIGSLFDDKIEGNARGNLFYGGPHQNSDEAHDGDDILLGRQGIDYLHPGDGDDLLDAGRGGDFAYTPFVFSSLATPGLTEYHGDRGEDTFVGVNQAGGVTVDLAAGTAAVGGWTATLAGFENAFGSRFDDAIAGTDGPNVIRALTNGAGGDVVEGRGGPDVLDAEGFGSFLLEPTGEDRIFGRSGPDTLISCCGSNSLHGGPGADVLDSGTYNEVTQSQFGEAGDDILLGSLGDDLLVGGEGEDEFDGRAGEDACDNEAGEEAQNCELSPPP